MTPLISFVVWYKPYRTEALGPPHRMKYFAVSGKSAVTENWVTKYYSRVTWPLMAFTFNQIKLAFNQVKFSPLIDTDLIKCS